ncbi:DUF4412 domain-containing protein [Pedobacter sp. MC2016-24]|uniref:DUF4412 domain-containing protein n=1 Tax=Pedobacter sp. MC2016-24 TaxID=2780090 RepID=UPI00187FA390|nr:DUF4412 domain-containing protein [Pedobacter sp. MC2016-24]MBE9598171.1 DUF4412 domain-containing protein [Pedobacter sp. MC2016-24]
MFKSIKTAVLVAILISTAIIAKAQKVINSGTITYGIEYVLTEDQKKQVDPSVLPSESKVEFSGDISKVQIDMGAAMLKVLTDGVAKKALVLVDIPMMQKQYAAQMTKEDIEKQSGSFTFTGFKATGEKQTIGGYNAEKYTYQDNNGANYELWVTNDIKLPAGVHPPGLSAIQGTPVKFSNVQDGFKTVLTLKNIKESKIPPYSLDVPKGYELKTMAELRAMRGGQ